MTIEPEECREPTIFNSLPVCIFVGIFLFIALLYRQIDMALLGFVILFVVSAAKTWSSMSLYRVRCTISVDKQRAFLGDTLVLEKNLENDENYMDVLNSTFDSHGDVDLDFDSKEGT